MTQEQLIDGNVEEGYEGPRPGERVRTFEQVQAFPVGTVLVRTKDPTKRYQKGDSQGTLQPGWEWYGTHSGDTLADRDMAVRVENTSHVVESLPGTLGETVEQYAWRFRDVAITGAERAFSDARTALRVLTDLDLPFRASVGLRIVNQYDRSHLPDGTRVYSGTPGQNPQVYVKKGRVWQHVSGPTFTHPAYADSITVAALVRDGVEVTEPDPWVAATPGPHETRLLAEFRARVWERGWQEKLDRRWCGEYERVMLRAGLSESAVIEPHLNGYRVGEIVTPEMAAQMAVGVILSTPDEQGATGFAVYERVKKSTNRFGLRRVEAWNVPGHFAPRMVVRGVRSLMREVVSFRCWSEDLMQAVPVGSVIGDAGSSRFMKMAQPDSPRQGCWGQVSNFDTVHETAIGSSPYNHRAFIPGPTCTYRFVRFGPRQNKQEGEKV